MSVVKFFRYPFGGGYATSPDPRSNFVLSWGGPGSLTVRAGFNEPGQRLERCRWIDSRAGAPSCEVENWEEFQAYARAFFAPYVPGATDSEV